MRGSADLGLEERAREAPVAVDRAARDVQRFGDLFGRQAGEIAQLNHARGACVGFFEPFQRFVERERLLGAVDREAIVGAGQRHAHPLAAGAQAQPIARAVGQQVAHRTRGVREELHGLAEHELAVGRDAQIELVHERGRVERRSGTAIAREVAAGHRLQALVDRAEQRIGRQRLAGRLRCGIRGSVIHRQKPPRTVYATR